MLPATPASTAAEGAAAAAAQRCHALRRPLLLAALLAAVAALEFGVGVGSGGLALPLLRATSGGGAGELDAVLGRYGSRLTAATWAAAGAQQPPPPPPVFFLTAARAWGGGAQLQAAREEQYATNIGNILSLGFPVYVSVSPGPPNASGPAFPLLQELAAAAPPGLLRVHYCSQATAVRRRSGGADELLCMQEAIPALFAGCVLPVEPYAPLAAGAAPPGCPTPDTHVIRMSGRYLMAKYTVLRAVRERGRSADAFFKWHANWTETNPFARTLDPEWQPMNVRQVMTFMISMKLRHFVQCHMMGMSVAGGWSSASRSVWRFAIEKLTADCILQLPAAEELSSLGVLGNVGNSDTFEFF